MSTHDPTPDRDPMLTRQQVAAELNISPSKTGNLIREGTLFAIQIGREYRVPRSVLDAFRRGEKLYPGPRDGYATQPDVTTWPPTPSMLEALDGRDSDATIQADDDRHAREAAEQVIRQDRGSLT